jgi:hypothetical protein
MNQSNQSSESIVIVIVYCFIVIVIVLSLIRNNAERKKEKYKIYKIIPKINDKNSQKKFIKKSYYIQYCTRERGENYNNTECTNVLFTEETRTDLKQISI